jgi:prepilin-type processing-associated H-X9-DG protein
MATVRNRSGGGRRGFTLVDLMVCVLIVCLLTGLLFGQVGQTREAANRAKCHNNLRVIGQLILLYANENKGAYPRTAYGPGEPLTQYTGVACENPFGKEGAPAKNDLTAAMFLLLRTQDATAEVFCCPSTAVKPAQLKASKTVRDMSNFPSEENLSYSVALPYPDRAALNIGYRWNATVAAEFAVMADMNPGGVGAYDVTPAKGPRDENAPPAVMQRANSMNHDGAGQNVLYGDGHVAFQDNPFVGVKRDNIYTVSGSADGSVTTSGKISGTPAWQGDSVLLPAATKALRKLTPAEADAADLDDARKYLARLKRELAENEQRVERLRRAIAETEKRLAEHERRGGEGDIPDRL